MAMYWKIWLLNYCPKDWTLEDKLQFVQVDCPDVTMEQVMEVEKLRID